MVDTKLIKEYVINATALGYDVHKAIELIDNIHTEDDISKALTSLRAMNDIKYCYYKEVSIEEVIERLNDAKGLNKTTLKISLKRKVKNLF